MHNILKNVVDNELGFADTGIRRPESTKVNFWFNFLKNNFIYICNITENNKQILTFIYIFKGLHVHRGQESNGRSGG